MTKKNAIEFVAAGIFAVVCAAAVFAHGAAPVETATPLLQQPIANLPGHSFTSAIVDFPPGARAAPHRHGDAFVYAYVLAGEVRSRLDGETAKTYRAGDDWFEAPGAHHVLTENPSRSAAAKLLVVFVGPSGQPLKRDDPPRDHEKGEQRP